MVEMTRMLPFARPTIDEESIQSVVEVLRSAWIASGPKVTEFEAALSRSFGGRPTRVVTSATAALEIALGLCSLEPGDEVITAAQSFFASMNMIVKVGAKPVFVDCELVSRSIDLDAVEAAITARTKVIMPTHFPGALVDMDALYGLARRRGLRVIEDAALVQGSCWQGQPVGSFGDIAAFSFHPNKNMTTIEGGALVVNAEAEAKRAEILRFHGITRLPDDTRDVVVAGGKFNMSDVSAAIGLHQLRRLPALLEKRARLADRYFERFAGTSELVLPPAQVPQQTWNMFCVLLPLERLGLTRQAFREALRARGIGTGLSYEACHLTTLGRELGYREGQFPNAEQIGRQTVTLPLFPEMELEDVDRVVTAVNEVLEGGK